MSSWWRCSIIVISLSIAVDALAADSFHATKQIAKRIYQDHRRTFYCGCPYDVQAKRVAITHCGYKLQKNFKRAERLEWEHVMPVSVFSQGLDCFQKPLCCNKKRCYKGRRCCAKLDQQFITMENDLHNLVPAIGELNGLRSNYRFSELPHIAFGQFGRCQFKIDSKTRRVEPSKAIKGMIARIYFYMADRYHIHLSSSQQQLFKVWDLKYPPDAWEIERDQRIAQLQGNHNPYITNYVSHE